MVIPHSGNVCSGLCRAPCGHADCWQCEKIVAVEAEKALKDAAKRISKSPSSTTVYPGVPRSTTVTYKQAFAETQTTTITRVALENLCERAGLDVVWNGGDPIIREKDAKHGRHLNDVSPDPLAEAAKRIAASASTTIDQMVKEALKGPTPEVLRIQGIPGLHKQVDAMTSMRAEVERLARIKADAEEKEARDILKAQGASDEDIAAAKALFDWSPKK